MSDRELERVDFHERTLAQADALANAFDDPAALARNLAEWVKENFPERVATAYWIDVQGNRDKGIDVRLYERQVSRWRFRLGALFGEKTGGVAVTAPIATTNGVTIGVGIGAVAPWEDLRDVRPVAVLNVRF